jgi:predicted N-acyltransferase
MVKSMASHFLTVLKEEDFSIQQICQAFKIEDVYSETVSKENMFIETSKLKVEHVNTILDVPKEQWNNLLGNRGTFDWNGLNLLESTFVDNNLPEENWDFDYITIKDENDKVVLATFLTTAITKDDMLSPAEISYEIEVKRQDAPYFYSSKTLQMGSLLTEGNHLYLDKDSQSWKEALKIFLIKVAEIQESNNASNIMLRDLSMVDKEMDDLMINNGFIKMEMPESNGIKNMDWLDDNSFRSTLSKRSRKHFNQDVINNKDKFQTKIVKDYSEEDLKKYYDLYLNVKNNNLALNTYTFPFKLFKKFAENPNWELMTLSLKPEFTEEVNGEPLAVCIIHKGLDKLTFMLIGMDYDSNKEHKTYRQAMYRFLLRARELGYTQVDLGYSSNFEKRKFGATQTQSCAYMQVKDNYNMESLNALSISKSNKNSKI